MSLTLCRPNNEQPLKVVIQELLKAYQLNNKVTESRIISIWKKLMGNMIVKHTKRVYVKNAKLYISLDSAPLKQELFYGREKIIQLINKEIGEEYITGIKFW